MRSLTPPAIIAMTCAGTSLLVFAAAWAGIELAHGTDQIASVWVANAILVAIVFRAKAVPWSFLIGAGLVGNLAANTLAGDTTPVAVLLACCNSIEVVVCVALVKKLFPDPDFRQPAPTFALCAVAVGPATLLSAALATAFLHWLRGADPAEVFASWYAADALGLVLVAPVLLIIRRHDLLDLACPPLVPRTAAATLLLVGVLAVVFFQSSMPLLFLAVPVIVCATFMLGFAGAALSIVITSGIGLWATLHDLGPIALSHDPLRVQIYILQLFLAVSALCAIAVASLVEQRELLATAFDQASDFQYVKDRQSRFVAVNLAVSSVHGLATSRALIGKSDFDLEPPERAARLVAEEQDLMARNTSLTNHEERLQQGGVEKWFETSKVPIHSASGRVVGLVGVTRDITARKALERQVTESRDRLELVLREMADGVAVIGADHRLVICNERYREFFPLTKDLRVPGAFYPSVLYSSLERGEQPDVAKEQSAEWVRDVLGRLKVGGDHESRMFDGRWLHVRIRPGSDGSATIVVSDITEIKRAETELRAMTAELRLLANTDGLTGLLNRRSFDDRLQGEIARCRRVRSPISLLMIDIDRFKTFNDLYGHPAGDECLRRVARILESNAKRPGDAVARYGGEELAIILPETDESGAFVLAERLRLAVRDLAIAHEGSDKKIVTISAGVAALSHDGSATSALELLSRADEALYIAKDAGRDRVMGWSARLLSRKSSA